MTAMSITRPRTKPATARQTLVDGLPSVTSGPHVRRPSCRTPSHPAHDLSNAPKTGAPHLTGARLAKRLASGDERALGEVYDLHGRSMYVLALAIVKEPVDAEEVVAEAFQAFWQNPEAYNPGRGSLGAYLTVMTRSRALDHVRSRRRRVAVEVKAQEFQPDHPVAHGQPPAGPEEQLETHETRKTLGSALSQLPEPQRESIMLAYLEGLTHREVAERLKEPLGTVKTRIRDGMARLRDMLTAPSREESPS